MCGLYTKKMPKYSIVVPFHNEEENVTALYDRLKAVMEQIGDSFELVLVDDGSSDRTYKLLEEIAAVDSRVLVVKLTAQLRSDLGAWLPGFDHSQGDYILAMDGDLQHDPTLRFRSLSPSWKRGTTLSAAGARSALTTTSCAAFHLVALTG